MAKQRTPVYESIALCDVSYLFSYRWHPQAHEERSTAAPDTLAHLGRIRQRVGHLICCLDSKPYNRSTIYPEYKGNREPESPNKTKAKRWLLERLRREGYVLAHAPGYEADDIIATLAAALRLSCDDVRIVGRDKDLYQLCNHKVRIFEPAVGDRPETLVDSDEVFRLLGVAPVQVPEWLALVGDKADNIPGCPGVGKQTATKLVAEFGTLDKLYRELDAEPVRTNAFIGKAIAAKLLEHRVAVMQARELVRLQANAPLDIEALLQPGQREERPISREGCEGVFEDLDPAAREAEEPQQSNVRELRPKDSGESQEPGNTRRVLSESRQAEPEVPAADGVLEPEEPKEPEPEAKEAKAKAKSEALALARQQAALANYERQLEPVEMRQAIWLAQQMEEANLFPKLSGWQSHLLILMAGRELGLGAMASLMNFSIVEGRPSPSWQLVVGLTQKHPDCEYFKLIASTDEAATYETKRRGCEPNRMTFTMQQAKKTGLVKPFSGWDKWPAAMLRKICAVHLSRAVYPDSPLAGFYLPEELAA